MDFQKIIEQLEEDFEAIQMARPPFVLEKFVVGAHDHHPAQAWAQCVLEMQIKYDAIRRAQIRRQQLLIEIERLATSEDEVEQLEAGLKRIDLEEQDRAELGARREFEALWQIYESFGRRYSREELNQAQPEYWQTRLQRQAEHDLLASGRVSPGNQEALRQIGTGLPSPNRQIAGVQQRYLSQGNRRLLIVVPTAEKAEQGLPCLEGLVIPGGIEHRVHNIYGLPVAQAYNEAGMMALQEQVDWLLTVEDDTFLPEDGLARLIEHGLDIVGGWYPKRSAVRQGVPIVLQDKMRTTLDDPDGSLREVYTIPNGFTLIRREVFERVPYPWFMTTPQLSQDSFFSQKAREAGYTLWCDTSVRCRHVDRESGQVFE